MKSAFQQLEEIMSRNLPEGVVWALRDPTVPGVLFPAEADAIVKAVPRRQVEFSAGRDALRSCLVQLGHPEQPIAIGARRAPVLPHGMVATLTHSRALCLAVGAHAIQYSGIGVDLEEDSPLSDDLRAMVLRDEEQDLDGHDAKIAFSIKETVYKALSSGLDRVMEFHEVSVSQVSSTVWRARLHQSAAGWKPGAVFDVAVYSLTGHILSLCAVRRGDVS